VNRRGMLARLFDLVVIELPKAFWIGNFALIIEACDAESGVGFCLYETEGLLGINYCIRLQVKKEAVGIYFGSLSGKWLQLRAMKAK
jgi:hypothetical protein